MLKLKELLYKIVSFFANGGTVNTVVNVRDTAVDLTKSNNGIESGRRYPAFVIVDKNGKTATRLENIADANGDTGFYLYSRQYNTSGDYISQMGVSLLTTKAGVSHWSTSPALMQVKQVGLGTRSVAANAVLSFNLWSYVQNACPTGFTAIGIVGFSTNHGACSMISARLVDSNYSFEMRNNTSSATGNFTPVVFVLYAQTGIRS